MTLKKFALFFILLIALFAIFLYFQRAKNEDRGLTLKNLTLYGNVDVRQVDLSFRVLGKVEELFFEEGDFVKANTLIATLDPQPYLDQVKESKAKKESAEITLKHAGILLKRRQSLIQEGSVGQEDLDNAKESQAVLQANLKSASAALDVAETTLQFTKLFAPVDGIILTRVKEKGSVVTPADPVYTLSIPSPVWVRVYIQEPFLGLVIPGMKATIYSDTKALKPYSGTVGFISPVAEFTPKTVQTEELRTELVYLVRIYADNPDGHLRQGMPVTVKLNH